MSVRRGVKNIDYGEQDKLMELEEFQSAFWSTGPLPDQWEVSSDLCEHGYESTEATDEIRERKLREKKQSRNYVPNTRAKYSSNYSSRGSFSRSQSRCTSHRG